MNTNTTNTALRYGVYALLAITLIVPLVVTNSLFFPFITGKAFVFRIAVELAFALWLVLAFRDPSARPKRNLLFYTVSAFTLIALVADLAGFNPIRSLWSNFERMEGWVTIVHLWAYFVVLSSVFKYKQHWKHFFNVSFAVSTVVSIIGLYQFFGLAAIHQSADRLDATLGNSEYLAVYMLFHVFLALYMGISSLVVNFKKDSLFSRGWGWTYIAIAALYSFILFGTQTRGTTIALGAGLFLAALIYAIFAKDDDAFDRIGRRVSIAVLILIVATVGIFYSVRKSNFVQSHAMLQRLANISLDNARIKYIWPIALKGFEEKPLLGWGQENFNYVFNNHYNPAAWGQEQWFDRAHNVFIDWAIAGGIVGFLGYLALYLSGIYIVWKTNIPVREKAILTGLLVGYGIHNIFVFDNLASYMMFFITLSYLAFEQETTERKHIGGEVMVNDEVTSWIIAPIIVIALGGIFYFIDYRPIISNQALIVALGQCQANPAARPQASFFDDALKINAYVGNQEIREQLYSCAEGVIHASSVPNTEKLKFVESIKKSADDQIAATPADLRGYLFTGTFFNDIGNWAAAKPYLDNAYRLSPTKQSVIFQLATNDVNMDKVDEGLALFKKAYDLAPDYDVAELAYARALIFAKKYDDAVVFFKQILAKKPSDMQSRVSLVVAYLGLKQDDKAIAELQKVIDINPEYKDEVTKYINQIKDGKNPFEQLSKGTVK
jgi:O-antigen ligase